MIQILTRQDTQTVSEHSQTRLAKLPMDMWPNVVTHVKSDHMVFPQQCGGFSIKFVLTGSESYFFADRTLRVSPIHFLTTARGRRYASSIESFEKVEAVCLFFNQSTCEKAVETFEKCVSPSDPLLQNFPNPFEYLLPMDPTLHCLIRKIITTHPKGGTFDELMHQTLSHVYHLMICSANTWNQMKSMREKNRQDLISRVLRGKDFLDSSLSVPTRVQDAAKEASLSKFHFIRCFNEVLGLSPMAYLRNQRLRLARYQLTTTRKSITDIAINAGYESVSAFSRVFSDHHKLSPRQFRSKNRQLMNKG